MSIFTVTLIINTETAEEANTVLANLLDSYAEDLGFAYSVDTLTDLKEES